MSLPFSQLIDNRYVITKLIAVGGMAEIYEANDTFYHRPVSIKILKESSLKAEEIGLFENEIRFASTFNNSHIYRIYNVGKYNNRPFMVYEAMKGKTLKDALDERGHFTVTESINFMLQICDALKLMHSHKITHNDLKPDNIMILHDGTIKLVDFGIATHTFDSYFTRLLASARYVAPEVLTSKQYSIQSDIYSIGIILFEFITGKTPYMKSNSQEEIKAHLYENIPSLKTLININNYQSFDLLIKRATDRDLKNRYKTVNEFEKDLLVLKNGGKLKNKFRLFSR